MSTSTYVLNQRISNIQAQINSGVPTSSNLEAILSNGNSAGSYKIDMNSNSINNIDELNPNNILFNDTINILNQSQNVNIYTDSNPNLYIKCPDKFIIDAPNTIFNNNNINDVNNINLSTINGSSYPPLVSIPPLNDVLASGNTSTNSITLNSLTKSIICNPTTPSIIITDGTILNTIDKNGYTTRNTSANLTHYLNFSDSSATGTGAIQKTLGISCNPFIGSISCNSFVGSLNGGSTYSNGIITVDDNTASTCYLTFTKFLAGSGIIQTLYQDNSVTPLSYTPSTSTLACTTFSGALAGTSNASNSLLTTTDNSATTCYIPFTKTTGTGTKTYFQDDTTGPLSYVPSTGILTATLFSGLCSTTGLVYLQNLSGSLTGGASNTNFNLTNIFNTTYKNYRISINITNSSTSTYPGLYLSGLLGVSPTTTAGTYGYDITSGVMNTISIGSTTFTVTPIQIAGSASPNKEIIFEIKNVGWVYTNGNSLSEILCNSTWANPGVTGKRDINILINSSATSSITGLTLGMNLGTTYSGNYSATIYGYK